MLDFLESIPAEWRPLALMVFVIGGGVSAVLTYHRGKKAGPEQPKVQEFYAAGQLADMGPVKELVETAGLLVQQQVRTNIHLEATAAALTRFANIYEHQVEDAEREKEIADEVDRRLRQQPPK